MKALPRVRFFNYKSQAKNRTYDLVHSIDMKDNLEIVICKGAKVTLWTCPGCLKKYDIDEVGSSLIQICHIHSGKCWRHATSKFFWGCAWCNFSQHNKCGYYDKGIFVRLCKLSGSKDE